MARYLPDSPPAPDSDSFIDQYHHFGFIQASLVKKGQPRLGMPYLCRQDGIIPF